MDIAEKMADLTIETIRKTLVKLEKDKLNKAVDLLQKADKIFLSGTGDSQIRARSYQNKLIKINKHLIIGDEYGEAAWNAMSMGKGDCAMFISYGGNSAPHRKIIKSEFHGDPRRPADGKYGATNEQAVRPSDRGAL